MGKVKISVNPPEEARLQLVEFILLMALLTSLVALSIDAMLPALEVIGAELNSVSSQQTYLIVSIFFIGMAAGQLFFGPFAFFCPLKKQYCLYLYSFFLRNLILSLGVVGCGGVGLIANLVA